MSLDNVWFYTLSTSAQVLAALTGLFAVFVVYKIQTITPTLEDIRGGISNLINSYTASHRERLEVVLYNHEVMLWNDHAILNKFNLLIEDEEALPEETKKFIGSGGQHPITGINYQLNRVTRNLYQKVLQQKDDVLYELKKNLLINSIAILNCVLLLTFTNLFKDNTCIMYVLLCINLLSFAFALYSSIKATIAISNN